MKRNGRADRIRDFVRAQEVAPTDEQIAMGIGEPVDRVKVTTQHLMRAGQFADNGLRGKMRRYTEIKRPRVPLTREQRLARRAQEARDKRAAQGAIPHSASRARRELEKRALRMERARQEESRLAAQKVREQIAAKKKQKGLAVLAKSATRRSAKEQPSCSKRVNATATPAMTSEDFVRAGGVIEVLCRHATAQPFKSIGIRAQDYAALDRRLAA